MVRTSGKPRSFGEVVYSTVEGSSGHAQIAGDLGDGISLLGEVQRAADLAIGDAAWAAAKR
jgi:hypothetical protein